MILYIEGVIILKRPWYLTVWLVLMTIGTLYGLFTYTLGSEILKKAWGNLMPDWAFGVLALFSAVNLVAVVMLWMWKIWGFYLVLLVALFSAAINGMLLGVIGLGATVFAALGVLILYLVMRPVWQNFK